MDRRRKFYKAVCAGLLAAVMLAPETAAQDKVKVALIAPLTGPRSAVGVQLKSGFDQAIEELNAKGGVNGKKLEPFVGDDKSTGVGSVEKTNEIISKEHPAMVVGPAYPDQVTATRKFVGQSNLVQFIPAPMTQEVRALIAGDKRDRTFFLQASVDWASPIASELKKRAPKSNVIVIKEDTTDQNFERALAKELKIEVTAVTPRKIREVDSLRGKALVLLVGPDLVLAKVLIGKGADQVVIVPAPDFTDRSIFKDLDAKVVSVALRAHPLWQDDKEIKALKERFKKAGRSSDGLAVYAYAAVSTWAKAVDAAKSFETKEVVKALCRKGFNHEIGILPFDASYQPTSVDFVRRADEIEKWAPDLISKEVSDRCAPASFSTGGAPADTNLGSRPDTTKVTNPGVATSPGAYSGAGVSTGSSPGPGNSGGPRPGGGGGGSNLNDGNDPKPVGSDKPIYDPSGFPEVVALSTGDSGGRTIHCTATMISGNWALTAAHCIAPWVASEIPRSSLAGSCRSLHDSGLKLHRAAKTSEQDPLPPQPPELGTLNDAAYCYSHHPENRCTYPNVWSADIVVGCFWSGFRPRNANTPPTGDLVLVNLDRPLPGPAFRLPGLSDGRAVGSKPSADTLAGQVAGLGITIAGFGNTFSVATGEKRRLVPDGMLPIHVGTHPAPDIHDGMLVLRPEQQAASSCGGDSGGPVYVGTVNGDVRGPAPFLAAVMSWLGSASYDKTSPSPACGRSVAYMTMAATAQIKAWICQQTANASPSCFSDGKP